MKKIMLLALITVGLLSTLNVEAYTSGKIIFLKGSATVYRPGAVLRATVGTVVLQSDTIITGNASTALIRLSNGATLKIKNNSRVTISTLSRNNTQIHLHRGGVFAKVNRLRGQGHFRVSSESTVAGVRGTLFYVHTLDDGNVWLCVNEGKVEVKESGSKSKVLVTKGKGVSVEKNKKIAAPKKYKWTEKLNWNMDDKSGEVEDKVDLDKVYDTLDSDYD